MMLTFAIASGFAQTGALKFTDTHKQLEWNRTACIVEGGKTPCRTVRYREYSFGVTSGFDSVSSASTIEAVDRQGSEVTIRTEVRRRLWLLRAWSARTTQLLLRPQNRVVNIDHDRKAYSAESLSVSGRGTPYWEQDDLQCSHAASHYLYLSERLPHAVVAGIHAVGYTGRDEGGSEYEVYFAPSIGCQQVRFKMLTRGLFGLPRSIYHRVVESYELRPPAEILFAIPAGYRHVSWEELTKALHSSSRRSGWR
jgi:hypothetical protein